MKKIVEKCRAPGKKTGSCAAEVCVCAKADDSPSVKRMGEIQPNVNGTYGGLVSRKEEEKSRLLVVGRKWWWGGSQLQRSCWLYITRFFFFFLFSRVECPGEFFFYFSLVGNISRLPN